MLMYITCWASGSECSKDYIGLHSRTERLKTLSVQYPQPWLHQAFHQFHQTWVECKSFNLSQPAASDFEARSAGPLNWPLFGVLSMQVCGSLYSPLWAGYLKGTCRHVLSGLPEHMTPHWVRLYRLEFTFSRPRRHSSWLKAYFMDLRKDLVI